MTIQGCPGKGDGYAGGTMRLFGTDAQVGSGWMVMQVMRLWSWSWSENAAGEQREPQETRTARG
jgi:hypothetical protein